MMRVNRIKNHFLFAIQHVIAQAFRPPGLGFQRRELMQDFLLRQFQRPRQARVQLRNRLPVRRQQFLQRDLVFLEFFRQRHRQEFLFHPPAHVLPSAHHIAKTQFEFLQDPSMPGSITVKLARGKIAGMRPSNFWYTTSAWAMYATSAGPPTYAAVGSKVSCTIGRSSTLGVNATGVAAIAARNSSAVNVAEPA